MTLLRQLDADLASLAEHVRNGIVQIGEGDGRHGTGVIVRSDGILVTNAHVIRGHCPWVTLGDGRTLHGHVLSYDSRRDLAVLAVEAQGLHALPLRDAAQLRPGAWVMSVGHPWGIVGAATAGVVVSGPATPFDGQSGWLVVSLHLLPGNSGGPLVDAEGQVVGIGTMVTGPDLAFAVPTDTVRGLLKGTGILLPDETRQRFRRSEPAGR